MMDDNEKLVRDKVIDDRVKSWIKDLGFPIVVAAYFLVRDYLFTRELVSLQAKTVQLLENISKGCQIQ